MPDVFKAYNNNGAFVLVIKRLRGFKINKLFPENQAIVIIKVKKHIKTLQTLHLTRIGGLTGIICPFQKATQYFSENKKWSPRVSTKNNLVFCHCNLSQFNIIVDPENLKIESIINWEHEGFWPKYFENLFYHDPRPSGAQFRCDSKNARFREFLCKLKGILYLSAS